MDFLRRREELAAKEQAAKEQAMKSMLTKACDQPESPESIQMRMEQLHKLLHYQSECLQELRARIEPVLRPVPDNCAGQCTTAPNPGSPLSSALEELARLTDWNTGAIRELTWLVDL